MSFSLNRAEDSIERYYEATRGIYSIIHIIDDLLYQQITRLSTENRSHLLALRNLLYRHYQSRLDLLSEYSA